MAESLTEVLKSESHVKTDFYTRKSLNVYKEKTVLHLLKVQNSCVLHMSYSKGHQLNTSDTLRQISTIYCFYIRRLQGKLR